MRLTSLFAAALLVTLAAPVFAEDAAPDETITEELTDEQDIALWCFGAFTVTEDHYKTAGDTAKAAEEAKKADFLAGKAAELLVADQVLDEEFSRLGAEYTASAYAQLVDKKEEPSYTEEECNALVTE